MARKAREDDPNAKEETDQSGHGGRLFRDTTVGLLVRVASRGRFLKYPEERDPEYYRKKYSEEAQNDRKQEVEKANRRSEENWRREHPEEAAREERQNSMQDTLADESDSNDSDDGNRKKVHHDKERGKDINLVEFEPNDPENPQNWSLGKKVFATGMVCLITFSIYVGSAIYSPGVMSVEEQFHVSESVAVLGLSAFVAGYGLGPMLWSPMSEIPSIGRNPVCKESQCFSDIH